MIHLYDANNVMRRAMEAGLPGSERMSLRMRYESLMLEPPGSQIWVWDGYQHNERRRDIYPKYKLNRSPTPTDIFSQIKLWREVLKHSHATQIDVHGWEADDVISTMARRFVSMGIPVTIHTNDMDYGQMAHLPGVTLSGVNLKGVPGRWIALYKAMTGDKSDNIDGIPGFGPKRWLELEDHWPQIERAIVLGDPAGFVGLPFKPAVAGWLANADNIRLLQQMLTITHFENVPDDELEGGIIEGVPDRRAAHDRLAEFFL